MLRGMRRSSRSRFRAMNDGRGENIREALGVEEIMKRKIVFIYPPTPSSKPAWLCVACFRCWCWLTLMMFIHYCQLKTNHFVGWLHTGCTDIIQTNTADKLSLHSLFSHPLCIFIFRRYPSSFDGIILSCLFQNGNTHIEEPGKYLPRKAHINIYICLFINPPQTAY